MIKYKIVFRLILLPGLLVFARGLFAQNAPEQPKPLERIYNRVSLATFGPGAEIYELFGHNAIILMDSVSGDMQIVNYGMFDFEEPGFISRFLEGKMMYWMDIDPRVDPILDYYVKTNRPVLIQDLNLTRAQIDRLVDYLNEQNLPENRRYLYNYYTNNCSTKVRDALDFALDGRLKNSLSAKSADASYRIQTQKVARSHYYLYTALYFVLGPFTDKPISQWDDSFLPVQFSQHIQPLATIDEQGREIPLIKRKLTLGDLPLEPLGPTPSRYGTHLLLSLPLAFILIFFSRCDHRWIPALFAIPWLILSSIAGGFILWSFTTQHIAVYWNLNILLFPPTAIPLALLWIPFVLGKFSQKGIRQTALILSIIPIALTLVALLIKPFSSQSNLEMFALALPLNFALYYVARNTIHGKPAEL